VKRKSLLQRYRLRRDGGGRQIVITAEKSETFVIRQEPKGRVSAWCDACAEEIECLTVEQAVTLTGLSARKIFRLVEAEGIHFCETEAGRLFICPNSIASFVRL
jgi:hypothetical protein